MSHLVKMFGSNVHSTVKPTDRPPVKVETVEYGSVAKWGKELILLNEWQAVEDALAAIIEGQVQPIAIKGTGGGDPFEFVFLFHTLIQWVDFFQSLAILHALPVGHQFVLVLVEPLKDQMQCTARHLPRHPARLNIDGGAILIVAHVEVRRIMIRQIHRNNDSVEMANLWHNSFFLFIMVTKLQKLFDKYVTLPIPF